MQVKSVQEGEHNLILKIIYENDENPDNNSAYLSFNVIIKLIDIMTL